MILSYLRHHLLLLVPLFLVACAAGDRITRISPDFLEPDPVSTLECVVLGETDNVYVRMRYEELITAWKPTSAQPYELALVGDSAGPWLLVYGWTGTELGFTPEHEPGALLPTEFPTPKRMPVHALGR